MNICFFSYLFHYLCNKYHFFKNIYKLHYTFCYNRRFASFCIKTIDFFEFYDYNYEYKKEKKLFEASFFPLLPVIM